MTSVIPAKPVIPAKAGIQQFFLWIPAFAGMTKCRDTSYTMNLQWLRYGITSLLLLLLSTCSDDRPVLRVITSGGFTAAYDVLAERAETELGIRLHTEYGSSSGGGPQSIPVRLERGERFDLIILSRSSLDNLTGEGYVLPESRTNLVRSKIGMAVQEGHNAPDISTAESFTEVLLAADSIGYSASASGTYLSTVLWPQMDLWPRLQGKSRRIVGERVAAVVARGQVEIGFQQISEILPIPGATYAGPIPEELQRVTLFSAGITTDASQPEAAARLLQFFTSPEVADDIAATGLEPVTGNADR